MSHASVRDNFVAQRTFRPQRQFVLRRFTVDQKFAAARIRSRYASTRTVALFADYEKQAEVAEAVRQQTLARFDHRRDDAFGVARTAAPDIHIVFA